LTREARTPFRYTQAPTPVAEPYVQITKVTVEPPTIHKAQNPSTAMIVVQIVLQGEAPPDPKITLQVGTYSSDPPNDIVEYQNPTQTVSLRERLTVVKVRADASSKTVRGKIKIKALIGGVTKGLNIKDSELPEDSIGELTVVDP